MNRLLLVLSLNLQCSSKFIYCTAFSTYFVFVADPVIIEVINVRVNVLFNRVSIYKDGVGTCEGYVCMYVETRS